MVSNHRTKLTTAEHSRLVATAERVKYNKEHSKKGVRKGGARKGKAAGSRLAYDALKKK
jgi:hypothetical protein